MPELNSPLQGPVCVVIHTACQACHHETHSTCEHITCLQIRHRMALIRTGATA